VVRRWIFALLAGCYNPTIGSGSPCETSNECPGELQCVGGICGGTVDAPPPADAGPDAPPDAPADALVMIEIGDDPAEVRDTEIWMVNPDTPQGGGNHFSIDFMESGLVWFDLTGVDPDLTIASATLTVTVADASDPGNGTATIHRMREAWVESEATWNVRAIGQAWSIAGARPPASDAASIADFKPKMTETAYSVSLPTSLIQAWVDDPATNFGLVFVRGTTTDHVHIHTREPGPGPRLTLTAY
jgi:hypothetical protein